MFYSTHQLGFVTDTYYVERDVLNAFMCLFTWISYIEVKSRRWMWLIAPCSGCLTAGIQGTFPRAGEGEDGSQLHVGYQHEERRKLECLCFWISVHYKIIPAKKLRLETYVCQRTCDLAAGWIPLVRLLAGADIYFSTSHPGAHKAPGERPLRKVVFGAEVKECMELCSYSSILF
jgi:hypothetical protein